VIPAVETTTWLGTHVLISWPTERMHEGDGTGDRRAVVLAWFMGKMLVGWDLGNGRRTERISDLACSSLGIAKRPGLDASLVLSRVQCPALDCSSILE
jgi:hypothetical protein